MGRRNAAVTIWALGALAAPYGLLHLSGWGPAKRGGRSPPDGLLHFCGGARFSGGQSPVIPISNLLLGYCKG